MAVVAQWSEPAAYNGLLQFESCRAHHASRSDSVEARLAKDGHGPEGPINATARGRVFTGERRSSSRDADTGPPQGGRI